MSWKDIIKNKRNRLEQLMKIETFLTQHKDIFQDFENMDFDKVIEEIHMEIDNAAEFGDYVDFQDDRDWDAGEPYHGEGRETYGN